MSLHTCPSAHLHNIASSHHVPTDPALARLSRYRVRTYIAHALLLSTLFGVPLSSGIWLEYYFTSFSSSPFSSPTKQPSSLLATSAIVGAQLACLGSSVAPTAWLYHQYPQYWRLQMCLGALSVCGAWLGLLLSQWLWVLVFCQGALTGLGLGVLGATSMLVLSTHYKCDLGVVGMQGIAAGCSGAVVYLVIAWACLRSDSVKMAYGVTLAVETGTMLVVVFLAKPHPLPPLNPQRAKERVRRCRSRPESWHVAVLLLLTVVVSVALLVPPLYLPLLLSRSPSQYRADAGFYTLFVLFGTALLTSSLVAKVSSARLSPTTLFTTCTLLTGISLIALLWMPMLYVALPCAAVFGMGLGGVCTTWIRVLAKDLGHGEGAELDTGGGSAKLGRWSCVVVALGGMTAGGGTMGAAAILQRMEKGVDIVLGVTSGCLILGGLILGIGAFCRHRVKRKD